MAIKRIVGIALIVCGVIVFLIGLNATDSFTDRFSHFFSGQYTDQTVWYMIGGTIAFVVGLSIIPGGGAKEAA